MTSAASYAVYAVCAAAAVGLWALSGVRPDVVARPWSLVRRLLIHPSARVAAALAYLWVGWHLFAR